MFDSTDEIGSNIKEISDQKMQDELICDLKNKVEFNSGRWSDDEHFKFIEGIIHYGNDWKRVQKIIKSRSSTQARLHAQKFFSQIKKYIIFDEIKSTDFYKKNQDSPKNQKDDHSGNFTTQHLLELLSFQDKNKNKCRISRLTMAQKEKLMNTIIKLFNSSDITKRKRTGSTGLDVEEGSIQDQEEFVVVENIAAMDMNSINNTKINNKIFLIQKDNKHKNSDPLSYTFKHISNSQCPDNINRASNNPQLINKSRETIPGLISNQSNIYNEMKRFFMSKKDNSSTETSPIQPRVIITHRPRSTTNVLNYNWLNNRNFFPNNKGENDVSPIANPFTLNFDCFCNQNINEYPNTTNIILEEDDVIMDAEYNDLGYKL